MTELPGQYKNLLIIAGTGRNSGKTTLACQVINKFRQLSPVAVKISPHFHEPAAGLLEWHIEDGFSIFTENNKEGNKDSSRMLGAGAAKVYYIVCRDEYIKKSFSMVFSTLTAGIPVVCESPSLAKFIDPGMLLIADNMGPGPKKNLLFDPGKADRVFHPLSEEPGIDSLHFSGGSWFFR